MKRVLIFMLISLGLPLGAAFPDEVADLKGQVRELAGMVEGLKHKVEAQQKEIDSLKKESSPGGMVVSPAMAAPAGESPDSIRALNEKLDQVVEAQKKTLPGEFNPSIGLVGETLFSYRTQGAGETGGDRLGGIDMFQRALELDLAASIDPFATGYAVINATDDFSTGEATLGVEEAAFQTTSLPWNLTLKGGRFFGEFGRLSYIHDHELPFVNRPVVLDQYIGGESQTDGMQVSWLLPTAHYWNLTVGVGDKFGDPRNNPGDFRSFNELNYFGRMSTYFDLTPDWQLESGISALINPHTDDCGGALERPDGSTLTERRRCLAGLDFSLRYVPLRGNQFESLTWGNEILYSDNRYLVDPDAEPESGDELSESVGSVGLYSYLAYKMDRQWTVGVLFESVEDQADVRDQTFAYSPFLTYAISHWNQLRLQYTHTDHSAESALHDDDAVYLQWAWIIGSHSHGWQQR